MTTATDPLDPEVIAIMAAALPRLAPGSGPLPEPAPPTGDGDDAWREEVSIMRARHDAAALEAGLLYDAVLRDAFGEDPLGSRPEEVTRSWGSAAGRGGAIGLRIYRPDGDGPHAAVALIHGGAYWMGGGAAGWTLNDALCCKLASNLSAVVVNIDHRLAPEHPFPAPLDDVCSAIDWIAAHAATLDIDASRIAVHGISSGGNLAAAASQRALDGRCAPVRAVVLQSPSVNLDLGSNRFTASADEVEGARRIVELYAAGGDSRVAEMSPGLRPDLEGLPPTLIITADHDPLADDARQYAERLAGAGVDVTEHRFNMTHTVASPAVFRQMHSETVRWLSRQLADGATP